MPKKPAPAAPQVQLTSCNFEVNNTVSDGITDAVLALANAATANAEAIKAAAVALRGSDSAPLFFLEGDK